MLDDCWTRAMLGVLSPNLYTLCCHAAWILRYGLGIYMLNLFINFLSPA